MRWACITIAFCGFAIMQLACRNTNGTFAGYTTERPFPSGIKTIFVEMFHNRDFRADLEFRLSEAIAKRIEMDTHYRIAPRNKADSLLSGELVEVQQNVLGNDFRTDLPRETSATYVISFRWKDLRTGKVLAERNRYPFTTTYIPPVGETFFDSGVRGLDGVAEELVEAMESTW